ncbi:uncharacterized protein [Panulirus ornatus]|uniref:uncharacterized protein n=1 Tax=Panulirus ornatus TaxID=150431 RepID=UPI003A8B01D3
MAALSTRMPWMLLLLLAVCCIPTSAASETGEVAAEGEGSEEAKSSREAGQTSRHHTTSATQDPVVFPDRFTGRPDARHPAMASLPSYFPFWPPLRHADLRPELWEEADDPPTLQRIPRHFPLVQARHQRNNPWRQARQQGYMARGQPQRSSSLWYWD